MQILLILRISQTVEWIPKPDRRPSS